MFIATCDARDLQACKAKAMIRPNGVGIRSSHTKTLNEIICNPIGHCCGKRLRSAATSPCTPPLNNSMYESSKLDSTTSSASSSAKHARIATVGQFEWQNRSRSETMECQHRWRHECVCAALGRKTQPTPHTPPKRTSHGGRRVLIMCSPLMRVVHAGADNTDAKPPEHAVYEVA